MSLKIMMPLRRTPRSGPFYHDVNRPDSPLAADGRFIEALGISIRCCRGNDRAAPARSRQGKGLDGQGGAVRSTVCCRFLDRPSGMTAGEAQQFGSGRCDPGQRAKSRRTPRKRQKERPKNRPRPHRRRPRPAGELMHAAHTPSRSLPACGEG